jgi:phosphate transport system substrate-binding protein
VHVTLHKGLRLLMAWMLAVAAAVLIQAAPAGASEPVNGGGSTWSAVAIESWQRDIARQGFTVNYQQVGSTAGRQFFYANQYDFAVSEIPFQALYCTDPKHPDPNSCTDEQNQVHRPYRYMPIVAGGTSFLYNIHINGQRFTGLRLSPKTLTEMFTGVVTFWDAADIAADNPGVAFPHTPVTVVIRSDGSGTSYQFTAFMAAEQPAMWNNFCQSQGIPTPCPPTSQYPQPSGSAWSAVSGSQGVANFVAADYNDGAIGYAEAAWGKAVGVPLASIQNASGAYQPPSAVNVAVALQAATINPSDNTQNLLGVYANRDDRAYPVSSYSYMIVPTGPVTPPMDQSKGTTLGAFILYFLCQGQQAMENLGYSPLPPNLVQLGFSVEQQVPGAPPPPPLASCNNPTITGGFLTRHSIASGPTVTPGGGNTATTIKHGSSGGSSSGSSTGSNSKGGTATTVAGGPVVNQVGTAATTPGSSGPAGTLADAATPTSLVAASSQSFGKPWRPISLWSLLLIALGVVGVILLPPAASVYKKRRQTD